MGIERFYIGVGRLLFRIVFQLLFGGARRVVLRLAQLQLEAFEDALIVADMPLPQLLVTVVVQVPLLVGDGIYIGCSFLDGMLVGTVETGLVDEVEGEFRGVADMQGVVAGRGRAVGGRQL